MQNDGSRFDLFRVFGSPISTAGGVKCFDVLRRCKERDRCRVTGTTPRSILPCGRSGMIIPSSGLCKSCGSIDIHPPVGHPEVALRPVPLHLYRTLYQSRHVPPLFAPNNALSHGEVRESRPRRPRLYIVHVKIRRFLFVVGSQFA